MHLGLFVEKLQKNIDAFHRNGSLAAPTPEQSAAAPAASVDVVEEIIRFKALAEQSIITEEEFAAKVLKKDGTVSDITLLISGLTNEERTIILDGCLINYYAEQHKNA